MYLEEKIDRLLLEQKRLVEMVELFLPNLETEKGVIHFLEITKATFNSYMKDEVLQESLHYNKQGNKRIFIPEAIVKLKKSGVKGRHKQSTEDEATLEAINAKLGIMPTCRHTVQQGL
jgi:hypothetical protein